MRRMRNLDRLEKLLLNRYPAFAVEYKGSINEKILRKAYAKLIDHTPVMRCIVHEDGDEHLLHVPRDRPMEFAKLTGGESELRQELRHKPHCTRSLSRLVLVEGEDCGRVALQVNHSFFDGPGLVAALTRLWQIYTDMSEDAKPSHEKLLDFPQPPSEFMNTIWNKYDIQCQNEQSFDSEKHPNATQTVESGPFPTERRTVFNRDDSDLLRRVARAHHTSMHAVLSGAVIVALRGDVNPSEPIQMMCQSQVDIRNRVTPKIGPTDTALVQFLSRAHIEVRSRQDPIAVGCEIKSQLDADITNRLTKRSVRPRDSVDHIPTDRMFSAFILNAQAIPAFPHPSNIEITDFAILPEGTIDPTMKRESIPSFHAYTYNGCLTISGRYPKSLFSAEESDSIAEHYVSKLGQLAKNAC